MSRITIRHAVPTDAPWLLTEFEEFSKFFGTKRSLFNGNYAEAALRNVTENHLFFVAENDEELLGFICGLVVDHFLNPTIKVLAQTFWWVPKRHQKTRAGVMLLNEFVKWGDENVDWITFGLNTKTTIRPEAMQKRGFTQLETAYLKEVR